MDAVIEVAKAYPWTTTIINSSGICGLIVWLANLWRGRVRVRAQIIRDWVASKDGHSPATILIELENVGREASSVRQAVEATFLFANRQRVVCSLSISEPDRTLAPVTPKTFTLTGSLPENYVFSYFRVFRVRFSRGATVRVRILNCDGEQAGFLRFTWLYFLFKRFGALRHIKG